MAERIPYRLDIQLFNIAEGATVESLACPSRGTQRCARGSARRPRAAMREALSNLMSGVTVSARARDEFFDRFETSAGRRLARGR